MNAALRRIERLERRAGADDVDRLAKALSDNLPDDELEALLLEVRSRISHEDALAELEREGAQ